MWRPACAREYGHSENSLQSFTGFSQGSPLKKSLDISSIEPMAGAFSRRFRGRSVRLFDRGHRELVQILGAAMKFFLLTQAILLLLWGCYRSNDHQECYEPIYLNETDVDVLFLFGSVESNGTENFDSLMILAGDTAYSRPGAEFPILHKEGLEGFWSDLCEVRLIFQTAQKKCLIFNTGIPRKNDIWLFSSYENIGTCYECMVRGQSVPDGMLYRITDDLLEQAKPCE